MFFQLSGFPPPQKKQKINDLGMIGWSLRGPGGGAPDFKFEGMIEWGQNQIRKNPSAKI